MPEISRFYGIIVTMYFKDHNPPHVHVIYNEHEALYDISTITLIRGSLPNRAENLFREWAQEHKEDLQKIWDTQEFHRISPLE